jgi:ABC-type cobalamin/Fe3+-siderophores transport system ATPase subunit
MKITTIDIPTSAEDGLQQIKMSRLGNVVLISGKNGAGKTRILNKISTTFSSKPLKSDLEKTRTNIQDWTTAIEQQQQTIEAWSVQLKTIINERQRKNIQNNIDQYKGSVQSLQTLIATGNAKLDWHLIETDTDADLYSFVKYVPTNLTLQDSNDIAKNKLMQNAQSVDNVGINNLPKGVFSKIQFIQDRWFNATHPNSQASPEEKDKAIGDYKKLKETIQTFFGIEITRTINDEATLFEFPLGQSKLSDGQKVLLQLCIAIYSQEIALKDVILVMDEPENHLHPSVIIEVIERIQKLVTNGQIWISTHSVPLLAHFDPTLLWYVENGKIAYAGKTPENVLRSLLGNDEEIAKLQNFISLPAQFAMSKYAFECLLEPPVVMTGSNDPQIRQIRSEFMALSTTGKLHILDYGAGKGRLISNLLDLDKQSQDNLLAKIDYVAFDEYLNEKEICKETLIRVFGSADKKYYNDLGALFSDHDVGSFDVVVMCNTLHEIDPKDWLKMFQENGSVTKCLNDKGVLLLVEDCQMPVGEMAYQKGFLVLDTPHVKDLFSITTADANFNYEQDEKNPRLKKHIIPKNILARITPESRNKALRSIRDMAKNEIRKIRASADQNYKNGLLHGFWTQQLANTELNLDEFIGSQ